MDDLFPSIGSTLNEGLTGHPFEIFLGEEPMALGGHVNEAIMTDQDYDFSQLVARLRTGDSAAAAELLERFEPEIRRTVRVRLTDPRLRRVVDSMDVCQSVFANFFVRASLGEYDLERPEELLRLLIVMVRNKVIDQTRRMQAGKRDQGRLEIVSDSVLNRLPSNGIDPASLALNRDLLQKAQNCLTASENYLAQQRSLGRTWQELAVELGATPDALRKQFQRAMSRVASALNLEGDPNE
jgi:RNA polymerase sigma-70 factor (ECF subfamily)